MAWPAQAQILLFNTPLGVKYVSISGKGGTVCLGLQDLSLHCFSPDMTNSMKVVTEISGSSVFAGGGVICATSENIVARCVTNSPWNIIGARADGSLESPYVFSNPTTDVDVRLP